jgi:hypothetical protein
MRAAVLGFAVVFPSAVLAQRATGTVRGAGDSVMAGATVTVLDSAFQERRRVVSDDRGQYAIALDAATRWIRAARIGFAPATVALRPGAPRDTVIDFRLEAAVTQLDTTRSTASPGYADPNVVEFERRRVTSNSGKFITGEQLRKLENVSFASILRSHVPRTTIVYYRGQEYLRSSAAGREDQTFLNPQDFKSPKGCWVNVYMDGMALYASSKYSLPPDMGRFSAQALSGVEFYSGGMTPLQFKNTENDCGTLLLWTRRRK